MKIHNGMDDRIGRALEGRVLAYASRLSFDFESMKIFSCTVRGLWRLNWCSRVPFLVAVG